jgi:AmiR/NasT family two-component response regulator
LQRLSAASASKSDAVVLMYSSSENPADIAQAKALDFVRGYIVKPFDQGDIETIVTLFQLEKTDLGPEGRKLH